MATANVVLRVEGQAVGVYWDFLVSILVHRLATDTWTYASAGEAMVRLIEEHWGILPDKELGRKYTDASGKAYFNGVANYESRRYKVEAEHKVSHDTAGVLIETFDDGTWGVIEAYDPSPFI